MIYQNEIALKVAEYLLEIKAIKLNPTNLFTWASGIQSPIYCDNRISLAHPHVRTYIKNAFVSLIQDKFEFDTIAGVATAGISHGALVADAMNKPFCYVRSKPKSHGTQSLIEGKINKGDKVVVVEDLFSTGGSTVKAIQGLREAGAEVIAAVAIFSYGFPKVDVAFSSIDVPYFTLSNFDSLLQLVKEKQQFNKDEIAFLENWIANMRK